MADPYNATINVNVKLCHQFWEEKGRGVVSQQPVCLVHLVLSSVSDTAEGDCSWVAAAGVFSRLDGGVHHHHEGVPFVVPIRGGGVGRRGGPRQLALLALVHRVCMDALSFGTSSPGIILESVWRVWQGGPIPRAMLGVRNSYASRNPRLTLPIRSPDFNVRIAMTTNQNPGSQR